VRHETSNCLAQQTCDACPCGVACKPHDLCLQMFVVCCAQVPQRRLVKGFAHTSQPPPHPPTPPTPPPTLTVFGVVAVVAAITQLTILGVACGIHLTAAAAEAADIVSHMAIMACRPHNNAPALSRVPSWQRQASPSSLCLPSP
jgi:hypothetical protein